MEENERIHIENSHKYARVEIEKIAYASNFCVEEQLLDDQKKFSLNLFSPRTSFPDIPQIEAFLKEGWERSDLFFHDILTEEAFLQKPIDLRHPFIFYYGHLTSFEKNQIFNYTMKRKSSSDDFDQLFERGIDPLVDDPSKCHKHSADVHFSSWPAIKEIEKYQRNTRKLIVDNIKNIFSDQIEIMAQKGRVFHECNEHTLMHLETLLYMFQVLDEGYKRKLPVEKLNMNFQKVFYLFVLTS